MPMSTRPLYQGLRWHDAVIVEGSTSYEWALRESGMLPDSTVSAGDPEPGNAATARSLRTGACCC